MIDRLFQVLAAERSQHRWEVRADGAIRDERGCCPIESAAQDRGMFRFSLMEAARRMGMMGGETRRVILTADDRRNNPNYEATLRDRLLRILQLEDTPREHPVRDIGPQPRPPQMGCQPI